MQNKIKTISTWLVGISTTLALIVLTALLLETDGRWTVFTIKAIYAFGGLALLKYADVVMFPKQTKREKNPNLHRIVKVFAAGLIIAAAIIAG